MFVVYVFLGKGNRGETITPYFMCVDVRCMFYTRVGRLRRRPIVVRLTAAIRLLSSAHVYRSRTPEYVF